MKSVCEIILALLLSACVERQAIVERKSEFDLDTGKKEVAFSNPVLISGSDFLSLVSSLKRNFPGRLETLLVFTSRVSRSIHSDSKILHLYNTTNINFNRSLKSVRKITDTLFVMNYEATIDATTCLRTITVTLEQDTCKLLLPLALSRFLK